MQTQTNVPSLEPSLPAVHGALMELHLLAMQWLQGVRSKDSEPSRIHRATGRVALAIEAAAEGYRRAYHLRRSQEAMIQVRGLFRQLFLEERIHSLIYAEARRRVDQIIKGLSRLGVAPENDWTAAELPAMERSEPEGNDHPVVTTLQRLASRLAVAGQALRQRAGRKRTPDESGKRTEEAA